MNDYVFLYGDFDQMIFKCIWLRISVFYFVLYFGPLIALALSPLIGVFVAPFALYALTEDEFFYNCGRLCKIFLFFICIPFSYLGLGIVLALSPLGLLVYYIVLFMQSFLMIFE